MHSFHRRSLSRIMALALSVLAVTSATGCDIRHLFGSNWSFNFYIPLGLAGNAGVLNTASGSTIPALTQTSSAAGLTVPIIGDLSAPAAAGAG